MIANKQVAPSLYQLGIVGGLFFSFGFITWLNGSLIPFLQIACELSQFQAYFVTMAFYISYTFLAIPMALLLERTGYKLAISIGLSLMSIGALLFVPAALMRELPVFLIALFVLGGGLTLLQAAANPLVVYLGPVDTAAVRISVMGVLNKTAGVLSPIVFTTLILNDMNAFDTALLNSMSAVERTIQLEELSSRLVKPYLVLASTLLIMALVIRVLPLAEPQHRGSVKQMSGGHRLEILSHPQLVLGAIALFFYIGIEVIAGDTIGLFGRELGVENFGELTSYTLAFMVFGYVCSIAVIPKWMSQRMALAVSGILGLVLSTCILFADPSSDWIWRYLLGWTGIPVVPNPIILVALLGFANAVMWPAIWPLALKNLPPHLVNIGSAILIMGITGGALLPLVFGAVVEWAGQNQIAYAVVIPCYASVLYFSLFGCNKRQW